MTDKLDRSIPDRIDAILNADTDNFIELCSLAGLDPKADFKNAVIRGANFKDCELSAFDFTNSTIIGSSFRHAIYGSAIFEGTRFKDVDLSQANDWTERQQRAPIKYIRWIRTNFDDDSTERQARVFGKILSIDDNVVVVDVGNGFCRRINKSLLKQTLAAKGNVGTGDPIILSERIVEQVPAIYVGVDDSHSTPMAWHDIKNAFEADEIVFGMIFRSIKGGFLVRLGLEVAFLPASQVDRIWPPDVSDMLETPQPFEILSVGTAAHKDVVVSRLAALKRAELATLDSVIATFKVGAKVSCTVDRLTEQGVAVLIDGVHALIHQSTILPERWDAAETEFLGGQQLDAVIIQIDKEKRFVRLSLNEAAAHAWRQFVDEYQANDVVEGIVTACSQSGVFVDLGGIVGMVHLSQIPEDQRPNFEKFYPTGTPVKAVVRAIDRRRGRIDLSITDVDANPWPAFLQRYQRGDVVEGTIKNANEHGTFVEVEGVVGLAPERPPVDFGKQIGESIIVKIFAIYADRSRLRLSLVPQDTPLTDISVPLKSAKEIYDNAEIGDVLHLTISKIETRAMELSLGRLNVGFLPVSKLVWKSEKPWRANRGKILGRRITVSVIDKDQAKERLVFGTFDISNTPFDDFCQLLGIGDEVEGLVSYSEDGTPIVDLLGGLVADVGDPDLSEWDRLQGEWQSFVIVALNRQRKTIVLKHQSNRKSAALP